MKNQWFGDQYDYRKYGLLRFLAKYYESILVSWMLTPNEKGGDGIQKETWDFIQRKKNVVYAQEWLNADSTATGNQKLRFIFHNLPYPLTDANRIDWWNSLSNSLLKSKPNLIFFDADNGFLKHKEDDVQEQRKSTYIYSDEIDKLINDYDLLLYQHRTICSHMSFEDLCEEKIGILNNLISKKSHISKGTIVTIKATGNLAFFLVLSPKSPLKDKLEKFTTNFKQEFKDPKYLSVVKICPTQLKTN